MTIAVIEDLHIVDETVSPNIPTTTIKKIFTKITENVKEQVKSEKLTLVFNGDTFDSLTSELWLTSEFSEKTAIKVFKNIQRTETAKILQREIRKLCLIVPVKIQYINGNHDLINEFPGLRKKISNFLEMAMGENIFFTNEFFDKATGIYATHGDKNDNWKIWQSNLGNQMQIWFTVKALVDIRNKTDNPNFREISNVGEVLPRKRSKFIKAALGRKDGNTAKRIIRQTAEQFFASEFAKDAIKAFFNERPAIARITKKIVCDRISAGLLTRLLLAYYYSVERDFRNRKQKKEIYKYLRDRGIQTRYIVVGHSHEREHSRIARTDTEFVNLGYCQELGKGLEKYDKIRGNIFISDKSSTKITNIKIPGA